jgi:hypothetical protein
VLFYGSINERRWHIIQSLKAHGVRTETVFGVYGNERDKLIARSKILLNVHFYEAKVFEVVRVSYLLANQRFVISERGANLLEEDTFSGGVVFADYNDLVKTCLDFLSRSDGLFKSVRLSAGKHQVVLAYQPKFFKIFAEKLN